MEEAGIRQVNVTGQVEELVIRASGIRNKDE